MPPFGLTAGKGAKLLLKNQLEGKGEKETCIRRTQASTAASLWRCPLPQPRSPAVFSRLPPPHQRAGVPASPFRTKAHLFSLGQRERAREHHRESTQRTPASPGPRFHRLTHGFPAPGTGGTASREAPARGDPEISRSHPHARDLVVLLWLSFPGSGPLPSACCISPTPRPLAFHPGDGAERRARLGGEGSNKATMKELNSR